MCFQCIASASVGLTQPDLPVTLLLMEETNSLMRVLTIKSEAMNLLIHLNHQLTCPLLA
jgi:hypothetical protein